MKKVMITGASGFLGKELIKECLSILDIEVWALTSDAEKISVFSSDRLHVEPREFPFSKAFASIAFDCVINCAYPRNTSGKEVAEGLKYISDLFEVVARGTVASVINISSQSLYDETRTEPATEESELCLNTPYAVGKYAVELMLETICKDVYKTNIRMASLIGPGFDQRIVNRLIRKALNGEKITINKSEQKFGFLDVKDATRGIVSLIEADPSIWHRVYNLGNGKGYTLVEIMDTVKEVFLEKKIDVPEVEIVEGNGVGSTAVSYGLLYSSVGFDPNIPLRDSVVGIVEYFATLS